MTVNSNGRSPHLDIPLELNDIYNQGKRPILHRSSLHCPIEFRSFTCTHAYIHMHVRIYAQEDDGMLDNESRFERGSKSSSDFSAAKKQQLRRIYVMGLRGRACPFFGLSDLVQRDDDRQYHQLYCEACWQLSDNGQLSEKKFAAVGRGKTSESTEKRRGTLMYI